jgi:hypothetical protein
VLGTTDNVSDPLLVFIGFRVIGCMQASATTVCRESAATFIRSAPLATPISRTRIQKAVGGPVTACGCGLRHRKLKRRTADGTP